MQAARNEQGTTWETTSRQNELLGKPKKGSEQLSAPETLDLIGEAYIGPYINDRVDSDLMLAKALERIQEQRREINEMSAELAELSAALKREYARRRQVEDELKAYKRHHQELAALLELS